MLVLSIIRAPRANARNMRQVTIKVHPLTKRVMICEHGQEPFIIPNHDFIFRLLSTSQLRKRPGRNVSKLTATIDLLVDEALARHIESHALAIGSALQTYHFRQLCLFADSALQLRGHGHVKAAIEQWLYMHGVDETEYAADTAYKLWQRHTWKLQEKNPQFFGRSRGKSALHLSKKSVQRAKPVTRLSATRQTLPEIEVELSASRFISSLTTCFRRPPKKVASHARIYYYMHHSGYSCRDVAAKLGVSKSTASYACRQILRRAQENRTFGLLLQEALHCALPLAV